MEFVDEVLKSIRLRKPNDTEKTLLGGRVRPLAGSIKPRTWGMQPFAVISRRLTTFPKMPWLCERGLGLCQELDY